MSSKIVVKLVLDSQVEIQEEWDVMLDAATNSSFDDRGNRCYEWSSDDWDSLGYEDLAAFDEWMDEQMDDSAGARGSLEFQYVQLTKDDSYLLVNGDPDYGIKVDFID